MKKFSRWQAGLWLAGLALLFLTFIFRTPIAHLMRAEGPWPDIDPEDVTTVIVGSHRALQGEAAADFVRLMYEDTSPHTKIFPNHTGSYTAIDLYSHGTLVASFYYNSYQQAITNSLQPILLRRNVRTCGEALERSLSTHKNGRFLYIGRNIYTFPQLTLEEMHSANFTYDGETVPIDAAQLADLPALLDEIAKQSKPSEKAPAFFDGNKTKPDMKLSFRWGERTQIHLTQLSYERNTILVYGSSEETFSIPLPAGYDLFAELGLAP